MEKPKEYSPEEIARIEETRADSDTEVVRGGADIKPGGSIEFTEKQKEEAQIIYETMVSRIKTELENLIREIDLDGRDQWKQIQRIQKNLLPKVVSTELIQDLLDASEIRVIKRIKELEQLLENIREGNFDFKLEDESYP